ncbi:transporter substrate-binding domain-containing protein [Paludibacterium sp. THUN1379]|nr:transporter substrate-binding domain-containing protein [Paludibacterium sp. THUN1379]
MNKMSIAFGLLVGLLLSLPLNAQGMLRIGVADSDGPPVAVIQQNNLKSGLAMEIGQALAQSLDRKAHFIVISRKRVEWALENGSVDIICNANPAWFGNAGQLGWTREIYPQVERIISPVNEAPIRSFEDLNGKRISTIRGYSYPALESAWATGKASRDAEDRLELMIKAVLSHVADAGIVTELEYSIWAREHRDSARLLRLSDFQFSSTPTMCAVSPKSIIDLAILNRAIDRLHQQGKFKSILHTYQ